MPNCSALNCKNKGIHLFPKDATRRKQWESALRIPNFKASHTARLCAAHFKQEDYFGKSKYTGKLALLGIYYYIEPYFLIHPKGRYL